MMSCPRGVGLPVSASMSRKRFCSVRKKPGASALTRMAVEFLGTHQAFSVDRARQEMGFEPQILFEDGLQLVGEWLAEIT